MRKNIELKKMGLHDFFVDLAGDSEFNNMLGSTKQALQN